MTIPNTGFPSPQGGQQSQQGPFGVPLGPNGQPQLIAPQGGPAAGPYNQQGQLVQQGFMPQGFQQQQVPQQIQAPQPLPGGNGYGYDVSQIPQILPTQGALPNQPGAQQQNGWSGGAPQGQGQQFAPPQGQQFNPTLQQASPAAALNDQTIISGPAWPAELQGRTFAEVKAIYAGLRTVAMQQGQQGMQQQQVPQVAQHPQQQVASPNGQQQVAPPDFWRDPAAAVAAAVDRAVDQRVTPMLQPVIQGQHQQAVSAALQQVASEFSDFEALKPQILASLQGADPRMLGNAEMWRTAYFVTRGRLGMFQQAQPNGHQQPLLQSQQAPQGGFQPQQVNHLPNYQPVPNLQSFFTEQPGRQGPQNMGINLNQAQLYAAQKMGMTPESYAAWMGGVGR